MLQFFFSRHSPTKFLHIAEREHEESRSGVSNVVSGPAILWGGNFWTTLLIKDDGRGRCGRPQQGALFAELQRAAADPAGEAQLGCAPL